MHMVTKEANINKKMTVAQYKAALSRLSISDISKKKTKTYTTYTKENYRSYIENPSNNEAKIRDMSNFLYRVSMPYRRFINYLSDIPLFYWNLTPQIELTEKLSGEKEQKKILDGYYKVLKLIDNMNLSTEFRKVLNTVIREGVFYGFIYEDKNSFFIHKLDPDYCRIVEIEAGCYNFAMDMSFFSKNKTYLDYMDPYFQSLYALYEKNSSEFRWQLIEPSRSICVKVDPDIVDENLPILIGIFEALMDLIDARTLQRNKDEIQNYKLIILKVPTFDNAKEVDDFSLEMDTIINFYNRLNEVVPDAVGIGLSPMDFDTVEFETDDNSNDLISASMKAVFSDSGIAQLLFNTDSADSLASSAIVDSAFVWKIVSNLETWMRRYIMYKTTGTQRYFFEILPVDIFNRDDTVDRELKLANSGVPNKMKLAASSGLNPFMVMSNQTFENNILQVHMNWIPLQTSYTMSSSTNFYKQGETSDG